MTEHEALLRAVCENPDDDTPRLVFADWLQENGEEERAEFIRLQVQFAALYRNGVPTASATLLPFAPHTKPLVAPDPQALRKQERAIWAQQKKRFRAELPEIRGVVWFPEFHRGFVEMITVTSDAQLVRHTDTIFNQAPIRHVTITRFAAVGGFAHLPHLRRLRTLKLINRSADTAIVRRLLLCDQLSESALLFVHLKETMSPRLRDDLQTAFGDRVRIQ